MALCQAMAPRIVLFFAINGGDMLGLNRDDEILFYNNYQV